MPASISYSRQTNLGTFLIDNSQCLYSSLSTIQNNFTKLEQTVESMSEKTSGIQSIISSFYLYNSSLSYVSTYLPTLSNFWIASQELIINNHKTWESKLFSLYYTKIINLSTWYTTSSIKYSEIPLWLENNFPSGNFPSSQIIDVFVFLKEDSTSDYSFDVSFEEKCQTQTLIPPISCSNCGVLPPDLPAEVLKTLEKCKSKIEPLSITQPCEGSGGRLLSLGLTRSGIKDSGIRRVEKVSYRKSKPADGVGLNKWYLT